MSDSGQLESTVGFPGIAGSAAAHWQRMRWRLNRLRCMSIAEIGHRLVQRGMAQAERWGVRGSSVVPAFHIKESPAPWVRLVGGIDKAPYLAAADRLAAGRFDIFALRDVALGDPAGAGAAEPTGSGSPLRWNRDPRTGIEAPLTFGKLLDYRDPLQVGDIKYLWEPNRHLHLVTLAQAYALSGDKKYFAVIQQHLESWFAACPAGRGPNWSSALEAGIRLINWSITWQLLGGAGGALFEDARTGLFRQHWLQSVYQHAEFIRGYFSRHSSANNHLIGEASGLFIAAMTWPYWPEAKRWRTISRDILEREARRQNFPDGVNREQAVAYQQFEIDLLLLPLLAARANRMKFSDEYSASIERMLAFLASIMDVAGNVPMIGDADDGMAVRLAQGDGFCRYRSALATGAILFGRSDFKRKAKGLDDKTRWLLGRKAEVRFAALPITGNVKLPVRRAFAEGGYYILGCDFETDREIRLIADAGPLGYQRIAAHGHADALSFTLSVGGTEFLIDPGTYAYHTQAQWREYFRGTVAHNTLCVDGVPQSRPGGNFMWLKKARAGCNLWLITEREDFFEGWHDGYRDLADPVLHQRLIVLDKVARRIVIEDRLQMADEHDIELFFHCSEHCRVVPLAEGYALEQDNQRLTLRLPEANYACQVMARGNLSPILGWVSRRFDHKQPTTTIAWSARLRGNAVLRSEIQC